MQEAWIDHFSRLLKSLESEKNGQSIHAFRRSFEAGKKQVRLLPQLEAIYQVSKEQDVFKPDTEPILYQSWFNRRRFKLTLGLKEIILVSTGNAVQFKANVYRLFSKWDPNLYSSPPEERIPQIHGISNKQLRAAMKQMNRLTDEQIADMVAKIPKDQGTNELDLEQMFPSQSGRERANTIVERVKTAMNK